MDEIFNDAQKGYRKRIIKDWLIDRIIEIACFAVIVFAVVNIMWAISG